MADIEKVIKQISAEIKLAEYVNQDYQTIDLPLLKDALELLKEQKKKEIRLIKKHTFSLKRTDEFSMRKLYEVICETLIDEGNLIISRTDDHEKVDFVWEVKDVFAQSQIVRCKDCKHGVQLDDSNYFVCSKPFASNRETHIENWYCADGEKRE